MDSHPSPSDVPRVRRALTSLTRSAVTPIPWVGVVLRSTLSFGRRPGVGLGSRELSRFPVSMDSVRVPDGAWHLPQVEEAQSGPVDAVASDPDNEVIVVENASEDGSADWLREHFPSVRVLALEENLGFGFDPFLNRGFIGKVRTACEQGSQFGQTSQRLSFFEGFFFPFSFGFVLFSYYFFFSLAKNSRQKLTKNVMINFQRVCRRVYLS